MAINIGTEFDSPPSYDGVYRAWMDPQIGNRLKTFAVDCDTLQEAVQVSELLSDFMYYLYSNRCMPDYANATGILTWDSENAEWEDADEHDRYL